MNDQTTKRRLAAILVSDVVGYSAMMERDEAGTLATLKRYRATVFDPSVALHNGRVVKLIGDGTLVEFASVVDAVNCALDIQRVGGTDIALRIGINLGDVIIDGDDIYGDGVNVAARLEPLAEPGGICIAAIVRDSLGSRSAVDFRDGGTVTIKNIAQPVHVWKWRPGGTAGATVGRPPNTERSVPALAVLPFQNFGTEPEWQYFAHGVVEDLVTALSRFRSFTVMARNSSFGDEGKAVDVRQFAREVGARYVLEGSVRRSGSRLRVSAQLIDGSTEAHLWAQNFDGPVEDIFDVQDRITESVVGILAPQIHAAEVARARSKRPDGLDAYDLYLQGSAKINTLHPVDSAAGIALLERAIALDPEFAAAIATEAWAFEHRIHMGWPPLGTDDEPRCLELARKALALARDDAGIQAQCGIILQLIAHEYDQGLAVVERAIGLNPNNQEVMFFGGVAHIKGGSLEKAREYFEKAIRLNPADPARSGAQIGHVELCLGNYGEALDLSRRALAIDRNFGFIHWIYISSLVYLGDADEARRAFTAYRASAPEATLGRIRKGMHSKDPHRLEVLVEGIRRMGMSE